jgi:hypothetical protein
MTEGREDRQEGRCGSESQTMGSMLLWLYVGCLSPSILLLLFFIE